MPQTAGKNSTQFPEAVLFYLIQFLPINEKLNLRLVSRLMNRLVLDKQSWMPKDFKLDEWPAIDFTPLPFLIAKRWTKKIAYIKTKDQYVAIVLQYKDIVGNSITDSDKKNISDDLETARKRIIDRKVSSVSTWGPIKGGINCFLCSGTVIATSISSLVLMYTDEWKKSCTNLFCDEDASIDTYGCIPDIQQQFHDRLIMFSLIGAAPALIIKMIENCCLQAAVFTPRHLESSLTIADMALLNPIQTPSRKESANQLFWKCFSYRDAVLLVGGLCVTLGLIMEDPLSVNIDNCIDKQPYHCKLDYACAEPYIDHKTQLIEATVTVASFSLAYSFYSIFNIAYTGAKKVGPAVVSFSRSVRNHYAFWSSTEQSPQESQPLLYDNTNSLYSV